MIKVAKVPEKSRSKFCFMGRVVFLVDFKIFCYIYIYMSARSPNNAAVVQSLACIFVTQLTLTELFYRLWLVFKGDS